MIGDAWREFLSWVLVVVFVVFPVLLTVKKVLSPMREYENIAKSTTIPGIDCFNQIKFENHATSPQDQVLTVTRLIPSQKLKMTGYRVLGFSF